MSLSATLFGRDSAIFKATNILGLGIPGLLDKEFGPAETEGPRLSDLSVQTSTYGAPIPRLYGTIAVMGNLIWLENNKLKEKVRKKSSGGKGGGGASEPTKTYSYSATFHLALCEGPIAGIRRIWCADKLIYNAGSDDLETIIASNRAATGWKLYLGTDDQLPDSRYEANVGVGNASAHRGMAYLAFYDFQLADYSNTLQGAQFKVEVVGPSTFGSSVVVDVSPFAPTAMTWESGAAFREDFTGLGYLSKRALLSIEVSDLVMGKSKPGLTYSTPYNDNNEWPRGLVSYGGGVWAGIQTNDFANSNIIKRLSDGFYATVASDTFFRGVLPKVGFPDVCYVLYIPTGGSGGVFSRVGIVNVAADPGGILSDSMPATSGYRINTCGDQIHEFQAVSTSIFVKTYTDNFILDESFSVVLSGGALALVNSPFSSQGIGTQSCMRDGVFYLCEEVSGGYRVVSCNSSGVIDDYVVTATSGINELYAFYMLSDSAGYIVNGHRVIQFTHYPDGPYPLAQVISSECELSGVLGGSDIDVSALASSVKGYRVAGGTIRSAIEPLQAAFPLDVRSHGYQVQFLPRGLASVATIPWEDLGAAGGDTPDDIFPQSREMDTQMPAKTVIKYLDAAREYAISEQLSERLNTEAVNKVERELSIVLSADEAAGIAEMLNFLPWLERTPVAFTLPPPYRYLEASDVVNVVTPAATYEVRLTETNESQDGRLECKAVPSRAALYTPAASGSEGVPPAGTIGLAGEALFLPLDIPVIDETLQDAAGFVGVMTGDTAGWPGGIAVRSIDGGQTWSDLQAYTGLATIGTARGTLPVSTGSLIDQRTLTIDLISGELDSVTRDQMLAGVNYAAYGVDGRWEIVRFQNATLQSDGSYLVSGFVRGDRGTERATGLHVAGDYFVFLDDPDNAFIGMAIGSIGVPADYRGITSGASLDDADDVPFTYQGVNLECLGPVDARGTRDGSSNFSGTFVRRSRLSSSWWTNGVVAPIGEASESYEIDVMNGSAVVRTIAASTPAFSYSAANQTTDFGSAQSAITFRIYQLSATVGRGYPLEVTL